MEISPSTSESAAPIAAELIWEQRPDGLFIQIPPTPGESGSETGDGRVFWLALVFPLAGILVFLGYWAGVFDEVAMVALLISLILAGILLWRAMKPVAKVQVARLPTTIRIFAGNFTIDSPQIPFHLTTPVQHVRDLTACVSEFEGFGIGLHGVHIKTGYNVRLTVELDNNQAHDVIMKCALDKGQVLQLETDLRKTLGLPPLKPP